MGWGGVGGAQGGTGKARPLPSQHGAAVLRAGSGWGRGRVHRGAPQDTHPRRTSRAHLHHLECQQRGALALKLLLPQPRQRLLVGRQEGLDARVQVGGAVGACGAACGRRNTAWREGQRRSGRCRQQPPAHSLLPPPDTPARPPAGLRASPPEAPRTRHHHDAEAQHAVRAPRAAVHAVAQLLLGAQRVEARLVQQLRLGAGEGEAGLQWGLRAEGDARPPHMLLAGRQARRWEAGHAPAALACPTRPTCSTMSSSARSATVSAPHWK